jgi:hypothetical protein
MLQLSRAQAADPPPRDPHHLAATNPHFQRLDHIDAQPTLQSEATASHPEDSAGDLAVSSRPLVHWLVDPPPHPATILSASRPTVNETTTPKAAIAAKIIARRVPDGDSP